MRAAVWAWLAGLGLLLHALHGCVGAPPTPPLPPPPPEPVGVFILLPDDSGLVGQITVSNPRGTQELTREGETVVSTPTSGPSASVAMNSGEVTRVFGAAIAARPGPPARFVLYFEGDSDTLTKDSKVRLGEVVRSVVERRAIDVSIIGHTDTVGSRAYNFGLGLRRAVRVEAAIRELPIDRSILRVDSHGKDAPLVQTGDNVPEPRNRRVEVTVR